MIDLRHPLSRRAALALGAGASAAALLPSVGLSQRTDTQEAAPIMTRPIPRTGEALPVVGIGTAVIFDIGADPGPRRERTEVIRTLVAGGGRLIDTAPSYGNAESVVGDLLAETGLRGRVFLATKVRVAGRDASIAEMRASLRKLRTEALDLMQLHNVRDPNQDLGLLREWKAQGICRYIGITSSFERDYPAVEAVLKREKPDFFQINYSVSDRTAAERLIPAAADVGAAVLTNLPFGRNRLFQRVQGKPLPEWAVEFDAKSWAQFFLKYLLGNPAVTAVIPGTDKPEYMRDNLGAGRGRMPDAAMRRRIEQWYDSL